MKDMIKNWFEQNYHEYVKLMKEISHTHDNGSLNPYHMEGSIWNHTEMVLDWLDSEKIELIFAALLHDIGKVYTRKVKDNNKVSFTYHENLSTIYSIEILNRAKNDFKELDIIKTLKLVAWHGSLWGKKSDETNLSELNMKFGHVKDFYQDFVEFVKADALGRTFKEKKDEDFVINQIIFYQNYIPYNTMEYKSKPLKEVIMTIGISGCGKSTWVENSNLSNYKVLSVDNILSKGKLNYDNIDYNKNIKKAHDTLIKDMRVCIKNIDNVIIDMTNVDKETRGKKLSKFPSTQYHKKAIVFIKDLETIYSNLNKRNGKKLNKNIINAQIMNFELPNYDEFDEIEFIL